jgi:hypothetical protein
MAAGDPAEILVSGAWTWVAPEGEDFPDPDSVDVGDDWGGEWEWLGLTTEPLSQNVDTTTFEVDVQQSNLPVLQSITAENMKLTTTLAEQRAELLQLVDGGNIYTTAAAAGVHGVSELRAGGRTQRTVYTVGFETRHALPDGTLVPLRLFFYRATFARGGAVAYDKGAAAGIPIEITVLGDTTQATDEQNYVWQKVTALPTP